MSDTATSESPPRILIVGGGALGIEVVGVAANRNNQVVIGDLPRRNQLDAVIVLDRAQGYDPALAIDTGHGPQLEMKVIPFGLGNVVELVSARVERAGRHFV